MTKRLAVTQLCGNVRQRTVFRAHRAWTTHEGSRWAAVREYESSKTWSLFHRRSGARIDSLTGRPTLSLVQALACVAALDALAVDWSAFDALPVTMASGLPSTGFTDANRPAREVVTAMVEAVREALR